MLYLDISENMVINIVILISTMSPTTYLLETLQKENPMLHCFYYCIYKGYVHDTLKLDSFDNLCRHEMRCLSPTIRCHRHLAPKKHQVSKLSLSVIAGDLLSLSLLTLTVCIIDTHPAAANK